jgi:hypothetical protein
VRVAAYRIHGMYRALRVSKSGFSLNVNQERSLRNLRDITVTEQERLANSNNADMNVCCFCGKNKRDEFDCVLIAVFLCLF